MKSNIIFAHAGFYAEHYDGRKTPVFNAEWKAKAICWLYGHGWFVKEAQEPLFLL